MFPGFRTTAGQPLPRLLGTTMACRALLTGTLTLLVGCNQQNPFLANRATPGWPNQGQAIAGLNPATDGERRAQALDTDNRELHAELAKSQQKEQLLAEKNSLLSKQLTDTVAQLKALETAKSEAEKRVEAIQASTRFRGGATITANDSVRKSLELISIPGIDIRRDEDVIRIELPADRLFVSGTAQLQGSAQYLLDQVADALARNYPRQMLGIEAHCDPSPAGAVTTQQLAAAQAQAIFATLTSRSRIPASQLFTVAHGANHPLASNATPAGRAKNRRIELVVYPDILGER